MCVWTIARGAGGGGGAVFKSGGFGPDTRKRGGRAAPPAAANTPPPLSLVAPGGTDLRVLISYTSAAKAGAPVTGPITATGLAPGATLSWPPRGAALAADFAAHAAACAPTEAAPTTSPCALVRATVPSPGVAVGTVVDVSAAPRAACGALRFEIVPTFPDVIKPESLTVGPSSAGSSCAVGGGQLPVPQPAGSTTLVAFEPPPASALAVLGSLPVSLTGAGGMGPAPVWARLVVAGAGLANSVPVATLFASPPADASVASSLAVMVAVGSGGAVWPAAVPAASLAVGVPRPPADGGKKGPVAPGFAETVCTSGPIPAAVAAAVPAKGGAAPAGTPGPVPGPDPALGPVSPANYPVGVPDEPPAPNATPGATDAPVATSEPPTTAPPFPTMLPEEPPVTTTTPATTVAPETPPATTEAPTPPPNEVPPATEAPTPPTTAPPATTSPPATEAPTPPPTTAPPATEAPTPLPTTAPPATTVPPATPPACANQAARWAQCGGRGATCGGDRPCADAAWATACCPAGDVCARVNDWWWQCAPAEAGGTPPLPTPPTTAPPSCTPVPLYNQCGGRTGNSGADAPWPGTCCGAGAACVRSSEWWWSCERSAATCAPGSKSPSGSTYVADYGQCGGRTGCPGGGVCADGQWPGAECCPGAACAPVSAPWYSQCVPAAV